MKNKRFLAKILITSLLVTSLFWPGMPKNAKAAVEIHELSTSSDAGRDAEESNEYKSKTNEFKKSKNLVDIDNKARNIINSGVCGEDLTWTIDNNGTLIISGTGEMYDAWPEGWEVHCKTAIIQNGVSSIGNFAFKNCDNLTKITIPDSVTSIGIAAFSGCSSLTDIEIPTSVTSIGSFAFFYCSSLKKIEIPNASIGNLAFEGCTKLTNVIILNGIHNITIPEYAFADCKSLTNITIPDSVIEIEDNAFVGCTSLTNITIPDSVTKIGGSVFEECTSLTNITIPDSVISIGSSAFKGCANLTKITIPDSVTEIGGSAFEECTSLANISISDNVTIICNNMFKGCISLTNITIPDNVIEIGIGAFESCTSLTDIVIPKSVIFIVEEAFFNCNALTDVYYFGSEEQWKLIDIYEGNSCLTDATIHYNVQITISNEHIIYIPLGKKMEHVGHFTIKCPEGYSGTASWTSSDSTVFNLHGNTSKSFSGLSTQIDIYGDALTVGKSTITITTNDGISDSFEIEVIENGSVMLFDRWDAGTRKVYFRTFHSILNSYYITDKTDISGNLSSLEGEYVWVSTEDNGDGKSKNVLSIAPVTSRLGILSEITDSTITVDDISYPISSILDTKTLVIGTEVVCHIYNNQVVLVQIPYESSGIFTDWNYQKEITMKKNDIVNTYIINSLTDKSFLKDIDKLLNQNIKLLMLDSVILRIIGSPKLLSVNPESGTCLYSWRNNAPGLKNSYPVSERENIDFITFFLDGNYSVSNDIVFSLREYATDKLIVCAESNFSTNFCEPSEGEPNGSTYFNLIFKPILPDNTKMYVAIEKGNLINNDTGEIFTTLCEKNNWWFKTPELVKNVWGFRNYADPIIDYKIYRKCLGVLDSFVFSKLKKDSKNGLCIGMAGTALDFAKGYVNFSNFIQDSTLKQTEDIEKNAKLNEIDMTADEYIKLSYAFQYLPDVEKQINNNWQKGNALYAAVKEGPVLIVIKTPDDIFHALMGYQVVDGYNEKDGAYSDIKVYDANRYNLSQIIRLYGSFPHFKDWKYLNHVGDTKDYYSKFKSISFVQDYPSTYKIAMLSSGIARNTVSDIKSEGYELLMTEIEDFEVKDSNGNIISKNQSGTPEQDMLIPIVTVNSSNDENTDLDMYWVESDSVLRIINNQNIGKKLYYASDAQMIEMDVPSGDTLSIATNSVDETMDIHLEHQGDTEITTAYSYVIGEEIVTLQVTGTSTGTVIINGKKDSADIAHFNISSVKVSYNGQNLEKKLNLPSETKVNVSIAQMIDNTYLKIMYDTDNDGNSDTDLIDPIPFKPAEPNKPEENKPGNNTSSGSSSNKSGSGSRGSSSRYSGNDTTIIKDVKKGYVNSLTGIITGTGEGYSTWQQDLYGWKLCYADGTYAMGMNITDAMGEVHEQILWEQINGAWYAFGIDGHAKSGFIYDYQLLGWFYIDINRGMLTNWQYIENQWYYFNPISDGTKGKMSSDTWIENYYVNQSGVWEEDKEKVPLI